MRAWLKRVLIRNISNVNRKYRTDKRNLRRERSIEPSADRQGPTIPDPGPSPSAVLVRRETTEALERAILDLPEHYRLMINLRYRKGLSYEEIARLIGRSEIATRRLWSRALHALSQRMKGQSA